MQQLTDTDGTAFLLLTGPEPDAQWERFVAAVGQVADRFAVRLTVGLMAIPMGVPHTRPTGMSSHATRPGLLPEQEDWLGTIQVPGHAIGLLEYRFGQAGRDAIGFAAHVPHYIARSDYPETARTLIQATADATGLLLPTSGLDAAAADSAGATGQADRGERRGRRDRPGAGAAVRRLRLRHRPRPARRNRRRCRPPTSWARSSRPSWPTGSAPATDRATRRVRPSRVSHRVTNGHASARRVRLCGEREPAPDAARPRSTVRSGRSVSASSSRCMCIVDHHGGRCTWSGPTTGTSTAPVDTWLDALYYATVTLSTTGYGDITPVTESARLTNIVRHHAVALHLPDRAGRHHHRGADRTQPPAVPLPTAGGDA